jgi:hypothetical protein
MLAVEACCRQDEVCRAVFKLCIRDCTERSDLAGGDVARLRFLPELALGIHRQHRHSATLHHAGQRRSLLPLPTPAHALPKARSQSECRPVTQKHATQNQFRHVPAFLNVPQSDPMALHMHMRRGRLSRPRAKLGERLGGRASPSSWRWYSV